MLKGKLGVLLASLMFSSVIIAENKYNLYAGLDLQNRHMGFKEKFGGPLFNKNSLQTDVYLGVMLNDHIGLESGWIQGNEKTNVRGLQAGDFVPGDNVLAAGQMETDYTTVKFNGWHVHLTAQLPVSRTNAIFASVGVVQLKLRASISVFADETGGLSAVDVAANRRTFAQRKLIPSVKIGGRHKFTEYMAIRVFMDWQKTGKLKITSKQSNFSAIHPKNSIVYGLGLVVTF